MFRAEELKKQILRFALDDSFFVWGAKDSRQRGICNYAAYVYCAC
jgi:hypothetical protein